MIGGCSAVDPYIINPNTDATGENLFVTNTAGYTQVSPTLVGGQTTAVFIILGQSNACNHDNVLYTPTNSLVQNLNIYNGAIYTAKDPLLGAAYNAGVGPGGVGPGGGWPLRLGDKLVNAGKYARPIFAPISVGGTTAAQWAAGGVLNHRIGVVCKRVAALGLTVTGILDEQGPTDAVNLTSQSSYYASKMSTIATFRNAGCNAPYFMSLETWAGFNEALSSAGKAAIRAAQAQVVDNITVFQGADTDTILQVNRQADAHWNATGSDLCAGLWQTVINAHL